MNAATLWYSVPATASHKIYNNGTNTFTIDPNGNVGIGYIDASYKLSVNGSIRLNNNTAGVTSFSMGGSGQFYVDAPGVVGGRFTILDNGNVGIGKTNPNCKLEVDVTLLTSTIITSGGADFGQGYLPGAYFKCRMTAYFDQSVIISGYLACTMTSVQITGTDYVGVVINTNQGQNYNTVIYIMYGSFTGIHRCFTNDELFYFNNTQLLKDSYIGRIVIASKKIATDKKIVKMTCAPAELACQHPPRRLAPVRWRMINNGILNMIK